MPRPSTNAARWSGRLQTKSAAEVKRDARGARVSGRCRCGDRPPGRVRNRSEEETERCDRRDAKLAVVDGSTQRTQRNKEAQKPYYKESAVAARVRRPQAPAIHTHHLEADTARPSALEFSSGARAKRSQDDSHTEEKQRGEKPRSDTGKPRLHVCRGQTTGGGRFLSCLVHRFARNAQLTTNTRSSPVIRCSPCNRWLTIRFGLRSAAANALPPTRKLGSTSSPTVM